MATADFRVYSSWFARGTSLAAPLGEGMTVSARGCIGLQGEGGYRLFIYFLEDGDTIPPGTYSPETMAGCLFLPLSEWADYVAFVQGSPGLCAHVDSVAPEANAVQSVLQIDPDAVRRG